MTFKVKDHYFNKAKKENFLARSVYKLEEIDQKYKILRHKDRVLDLGYYPGSWIQYTAKKVGDDGMVLGVDIQDINNKLQYLSNVVLKQMDIASIEHLESIGVHQKFDVILSDMAPKTTGVKTIDQIKSLELVELVFSKLPLFLKAGGHLVIKVFDSHEAQVFLKEQKLIFDSFNYLKPKSTRSISKEFFVIGKKFKA